MKYRDLTGKVFGRLTCIEYAGRDKNFVMWRCRCECGKETVVRATGLLHHGTPLSCGCLRKERARIACTTHGQTPRTVTPRLYSIWRCMKQRCTNPKTPPYKYYGERGIRLCDSWLAYLPFYEWAMSNGYQDGLTLDRIDNDGNYEPSNCRWATLEEQGNNRRSNHLITLCGETKTVTEWAKTTGINRGTINSRLRRGLAVEDVLGKYCKEDGNEAAKA